MQFCHFSFFYVLENTLSLNPVRYAVVQEKGIIYVYSPHVVHIIHKYMVRFSMSQQEDGSVGCLTVYTEERGGSRICKVDLQKTGKIKPSL